MSLTLPILGPSGAIANDLFAAGAVKFGAFPLKAHRANSSLPLSPYYFDCRAIGHPSKPGPVSAAIVMRIAMAWSRLDALDFERIDCVAAVPHGATPYATHLALLLEGAVPVIRLAKRENDDGTTTVHDVEGDVSAFRGKRALLVEDVVTTAASSLEAITVLRRYEIRTYHALAVVDRQQGGAQRLLEQNVRLRPLFTFRQLVDHYHAAGQIDHMKYEECLAYHAESSSL